MKKELKKEKVLPNKLQKLFEKASGYGANYKKQEVISLTSYSEIEIYGYFHSNSLNGKFTKVQKKFLRKDGNKLFYIGNKRFACPIVDRLAGKIDY